MPLLSTAPLNDDEYDQLDDLLAAIGPQAMDVAGVEGLLTALAIAPEPTEVQQVLPKVWGTPVKGEQAAIEQASALVLRHYAYMQTWMKKDPTSFEPIYECGGAWTAEAWSAGFEAGMALNDVHWSALRSAHPDWLAPFARLGDDWESAITPAVIRINAHWHPQAGAPASKAAKVGRNDPCPCGSGKKFKKCCDGA